MYRNASLAFSLCGALALAGCSTDAGQPPAHPTAAGPTQTVAEVTNPADAPPPQSDEAPAPTPPPPPGPDHGSITGTVTVTPSSMGKHIVVYLENGPHDDAKVTPATVDQKGMQFNPFITVVSTGAKVTFLNDDPFPHNVFSPDGEKFDIGTAAQGHARSRIFDKPGPYTMLCNLHPNMLAYVFVSPSTFVTKTDAKGNFVLPGVPNGTYTIAAWAPRLPVQTQTVTVKGSDVAVDLKLHR